MRTTLNLDRELMGRAQELTGIKRKTDLIHAGLESLIQREAARRLIALGGTMPGAKATPRRRFRARRP
jgi:Arc/MetJ family transcription regulator